MLKSFSLKKRGLRVGPEGRPRGPNGWSGGAHCHQGGGPMDGPGGPMVTRGGAQIFLRAYVRKIMGPSLEIGLIRPCTLYNIYIHIIYIRCIYKHKCICILV